MDTDDEVAFSSVPPYGKAHEQHVNQIGSVPNGTPHSPVTDDSHGAKERLKELGRAAKSTTKKVLRIDDTKGEIDHGSNASTHAIETDAGLNPSKVLDTESTTAEQIKDKFKMPHSATELKEMVLHPRSATQNRAAEMMAVDENPHLKGNEDDNLVETHEQLIDAHEKLKTIEQGDVTASAAQDEAERLHDKIDTIEQDREEKRVAWISSRYVHSARVLPAQQYEFPLLSSCRWVDDSGKAQGEKWSQWFVQVYQLLKHIPQPLLKEKANEGKTTETSTYDQDILVQETERILIASSPLQHWFTDLRKLRNWQKPKVTLFWFTLWLAIWSCNYVFTFLYGYGAYRALQTKTDFDRREALKDARVRTADDGEMNNTFGEMIASLDDSSKWLQPTLEIVGPIVQPVMRDTADWLEIMVNYPEWKTPRATLCIMTALGGCVVLSSLLSVEFFFRASTFVLILLFFVGKPLSARYPRYKQVLLPLHWIFWGIPTKTETSFNHVRQRAQAIRKDAELDSSHTNKTSTSEVVLFASGCVWNEITGTIVLTSVDIRFMRKMSRREMWRRSYQDLVGIKKGEGRTEVLHRPSHLAELEFRDGSVERLLDMGKNDTLFNVIFGFSGLQWRQR